MVINISVHYNGGSLPNITLLPQGHYHRGTRLNTMQWLCIYSLPVCNSILLLPPCIMVYYIVSVLFLLFFWCACMAINVSVQYNGGHFPPTLYC